MTAARGRLALSRVVSADSCRRVKTLSPGAARACYADRDHSTRALSAEVPMRHFLPLLVLLSFTIVQRVTLDEAFA
jgi:hypothetical protein